jgi:hypothetical protein
MGKNMTRIEIVEKTADKRDILICGLERVFNDDMKSSCHRCGKTIYHRPYNNHFEKKICRDCQIKHYKKTSIVISKKSLQEIEEFFDKKDKTAS